MLRANGSKCIVRVYNHGSIKENRCENHKLESVCLHHSHSLSGVKYHFRRLIPIPKIIPIPLQISVQIHTQLLLPISIYTPNKYASFRSHIYGLPGCISFQFFSLPSAITLPRSPSYCCVTTFHTIKLYSFLSWLWWLRRKTSAGSATHRPRWLKFRLLRSVNTIVFVIMLYELSGSDDPDDLMTMLRVV